MLPESHALGRTFTAPKHFPAPGSEEEQAVFRDIQAGFGKQYEHVFPDKLAPRTVVIIPSLTLDQEILSKVKGAVHYEERMLCLLMLLRMPNTNVIYVTSMPVADSIIDYYLHLLPGITGSHARKRLTLLSCYDASVKPLTQKILERPRLIERIRQSVPDPSVAHLTCYNITPLEKTLSVHLGVPLFGTDPEKLYEGSKSGGRKSFREAGVLLPDGYEDLHTKADIAAALASLKRKYPAMRKAVIKMNDGFSGDGNAMYRYPDLPIDDQLEEQLAASLSQQMKPVAPDVSEELFFEKFASMGGIVEEFLDGEIKTSPSVQCVIKPTREIEIVSTHDQVLGGDDGQIFIGAIFPADESYNTSLAAEGRKIAEVLEKKGALGRFAIDFISVKQTDGSWKHYAIEINLRKGGTTHPYLMLQFLTDGHYNAEKGEYITAGKNKRFYFASDNVSSECYKGLTPDDLIDIAMYHDLMYDGAAQEGVMFHLVGALSEFGKLGLVCVGSSPERAKALYDKTLQILDHECTL
ncbi:peptide ligase PGM1-related protein [Flavihumibacter rivuli]|uniref:peptide ligase PGM1-related protein n=1 Tax=Flavihumibacter rivuli TaxID=2838156 RepID=UPI001BDF6930|nr:peptide ligase PGM1-related protein [Flavihumibacter rivuli]ULQ55655.1 peptide ligase PGM1-related protein [Flavihumibacter rivuli]